MAKSAKKFEEEMTELEAIVTRIDSGELSLEESISAFERGVALLRSLNQKLDEVEKKVEVLVRNAQGELKTAPYEQAAGEKPPGRGDEDDEIPF
jgi:exodeoxyribonuclease VII small subunit